MDTYSKPKSENRARKKSVFGTTNIVTYGVNMIFFKMKIVNMIVIDKARKREYIVSLAYKGYGK